LCAVVFVVDELEDDDVDDFADGELEAACAIAVPPPTRAPEIVKAISALVSRCRIGSHLPSFHSRGLGAKSTCMT
jgi:hypothetical protein